VVKSNPRNREEEDLIANLYNQINKLKSQNTTLVDKNKELEENFEKKKKEVIIAKKQLLIRRNSMGPNLGIKNERPKTAPITEITIVPGPLPNGQVTNNKELTAPNNPILADPNLLEIARKYKARYFDTLL
jgi:hypothetical protein